MKTFSIALCIGLTLLNCSKQNTSDKTLTDVLTNGSVSDLIAKRNQVLVVYDSIAKVLSEIDKTIAQKDTTKHFDLVTTYKVMDTTFTSYVAFQGSVQTNENILIYPEYAGILSQIYVKQGQAVSKGQLLAKINDGGLSSQLAQIEAQYQLAKTTFDRQKRLWDEKIGSEIQFLQAKTNMESSENMVKQLKSQLNKTTITAPFSGIVDEIITDQGQVVTPGIQSIMRIINLNNMYVKAEIPEVYLKSVVKNATVDVNFPALNETVTGVVNRVGNYINPSNRTFDIEVQVPNKKQLIKPNLMANLKITNYTKTNAIIIPSNVIQENAQGEKFVYKLAPNGAHAVATKTKIEIGQSQDNFVEVKQGLNKNDIIVNDGALTIKDGETVTIKSTL